MYFVIGREKHQDGVIHYHVILSHFEKIQITNPNIIYIQYEEKVYHGNYSAVSYLRLVIAYVCKDKKYISKYEKLQNGKLLTGKEFIINEVKKKGVKQALMDKYQNAPEKAIAGLSVSPLKKHFNEIQKMETTYKRE